MPVTKSYTAKAKARRIAAASAAIARARATILNNRRSTALGPLRTGGFYGVYSRRGREELKVIDNQQVIAPLLTTGSIALVNGVAQGTDFTDRIGRKVVVKSIHLKYYVQAYNNVDVPLGDIVRVLLVWDYQANGSLAAVGDVLTNVDVLGGINLTNRERFKILYDKRHTFGAIEYTGAAPVAGDSRPVFAQRYIKCNMPMVFAGTANTIGSIQTGSMLLMVVTASSSTGYAGNFRIRTRFSDA